MLGGDYHRGALLRHGDYQVSNQIDNVSTDERPFYWACGKCGSRGLYRDDDRLVGDWSIACRTCGNRFYGEVGGKAQGAAPVKVFYMPEAAPPLGPNHFTLERTANILTGPGLIQLRTIEEKEKAMGKRAPCRNCKRDLTIVADDYCFVCNKAGKGLEGEEKAAALAVIKAKIESGGLRRCWNHGGSRKAAPKNPAAEMPASAKQTEGKRPSRKTGPCFNCGRVLQIQARGACCTCYPAAKIKDVEERNLELMKIRRGLGVKEFADQPGEQHGERRQMIPHEKRARPYPKGADIMRDIRECLSVIILSAEEMGVIEALRAGRIAIIS